MPSTGTASSRVRPRRNPLAFEDANSKLADVVTVADEDQVGNNLLQILKLRFGQKIN